MKVINIQNVFKFITLQYQLLSAFSQRYPEAKDKQWLLDFPKNGEVQLNGEQWEFIKHGAGLRFVQPSCKPHIVVDIHKRYDNPNIIDEWRLLQFFESYGDSANKDELSLLLNEMCLKGHLVYQGDGGYLFVGKIQ